MTLQLKKLFSIFNFGNYSKVEKQEVDSKNCFQIEEDNEAKQIFSTLNSFLIENECEYVYNWKYNILEKILTHTDIDEDEYVGKTVIIATNDICNWWHYRHPRFLERLDYFLSIHSSLVNGKKNEDEVDWNRINDFIECNRQNIYDNEYVSYKYENELQKEKELLKTKIKTAKYLINFFQLII